MRHALSGGVLSFSLIGIGIILGISSASGQSSQEGRFTGPDFHGIWLTRAGFGPPRDPSLPGGVVTLAENDYDPDYRLGDSSNPVLKPSAVAGIEARNARIRAGGDGFPNYSLCWPMGVPGALAMADPVLFLQSPDRVTILYQRSQHARHIYLNVQHSDDPNSAWFGESVGHYEGNTLVIDTIGLDIRGDLDRFGTSHSEQLRVVERYTLSNDGNALYVNVEVTDPLNFTTQLYMTSDYRRIETHRSFPGVQENENWAELVCAENNFDVRTMQLYPVPEATEVDF